VLLPRLRVACCARHHDLDRACAVIGAVPIGAQPGDLVIQLHADTAAHAHHHRLAVERGLAILEVGDYVLGHQRQTLVAANQGFNG